jgi:hypothetical protein
MSRPGRETIQNSATAVLALNAAAEEARSQGVIEGARSAAAEMARKLERVARVVPRRLGGFSLWLLERLLIGRRTAAEFASIVMVTAKSS